jgi:hypothetical protein
MATTIDWHNAANGHPSSDPSYACMQTHQRSINITQTFKATRLGRCPGNVIDYYKYEWVE